MVKAFSSLWVSLLLCGSVSTQSTNQQLSSSPADEWLQGKPLKANRVTGLIISRIEFLGNETTRDNVLRRELLLREDEIFRNALLRDSLRRLNRLGLFKRITERSVKFRAGKNPGQVDLLIIVKERKSQQEQRGRVEEWRRCFES